MVFILAYSEEYGEELFEYPDIDGAVAGWERLIKSFHEQNDGIKRVMMIVTRRETITSGKIDNDEIP